MTPLVAVIAAGMMGAAVGRRLADHGVKVLTSLAGRGGSTADRAKEAHMVAANDSEIAAADFLLSIVPPGDALSLAERFAPALTASNAKPVYVDCNAINPATVGRVAAAIAPTGCAFVDCGIIGPPPPRLSLSRAAGGEVTLSGPRFYASGPAAAQFANLRQYGLDVRVLEGPPAAASALKMSYAGITKGTQAVGAAMMLAAMRAGSAGALYEELAYSQNAALKQFQQQLPMMPAKAYRWVAEMEEIAGFVGEGSAAHELYEAAAHFYAHMAEDFAANKEDATALDAFLKNAPTE
jgi:3-hydroxyisobutyrate dehydrogenase-like beta-hydroxyacid dehydrogenase